MGGQGRLSQGDTGANLAGKAGGSGQGTASSKPLGQMGAEAVRELEISSRVGSGMEGYQ